MKKLVCIAVFSLAIVVNATEKNEIVTINSKEVKVEKIDSSKELKTEKIILENSFVKELLFFGCASEGNGVYNIEISEGASHRDARATRRAYVRKCRNYFWQFGTQNWF